MIYFIIIALLCILLLLRININIQHWLLILFLLILCFLSSFRNLDVGIDTKNYFFIFNNIEYYYTRTSIEKGYLLINYYISKIYNNFTFYLIVYNLLTYYVYYIFIKRYSKNYIMSILLFITTGIWAKTVNILRFEFAISFLLFNYLIFNKYKTKLIKYFYFLSYYFHKVSLVNSFALFFNINNNSLKIKWYLITIIVTFIISNNVFILLPYIQSFLHFDYGYMNSSKFLVNIKYATMFQIIKTFILFVVCYRINAKSLNYNSIITNGKYKFKDDDFIIQFNMIFNQFILLIISLKLNILDRLSFFYQNFEIVLIPNMISKIKSRENRLFVKIIIILFYVLYFYYVSYYKRDWDRIIPYSTIFKK